MRPKKITSTETDQLNSATEGEFSDDDSHDRTTEEKSAAYYKRVGKQREKDQKGDFWIAVGLYLILCSVALVVI